ncbi:MULTISPECIES: polysaccharide deacetylase family protein [unclassified Paenibacillus]|uniref:polysaccharide deacetylase family protein n=1 Tax=unclassified Paenibacillus TaxID=185978 RepID=UPI000954F8FD|nr:MULTISPECIES: polysaccharide deacetylase family protein [unclassified Paenibacillus]ASS65584.2 polysaccharide deacetylase family protein [Paenibacillus sp. RUD330]SIQ30894.1 Polysaccharide deacetylase [Paenibacillus sp. RU4X]SIQ52626.1 Polysaccharide deacetylase [Paenibacillus sp. RU4T]
MKWKVPAAASAAALLAAAALLGLMLYRGVVGKPLAGHTSAAQLPSSKGWSQQPARSKHKGGRSPNGGAAPVPIIPVPASVPASFQGKVGVLMYHDIEPAAAGADSITPGQFASELDGLRKIGYRIISLQQFRMFMQGKQDVPQGSLLITFDDGYESFYRYAYPILKQRGLSGACFVVTGDFSPSALVYTPHMTPAEIAKMESDDPVMEVQAHSDALHVKIDRRHDLLTGRILRAGRLESDADYRARITADTIKCLSALRPLNSHPVDSFAYPYGLHTPEAVSLLRAQEIKYAFTTAPGLASRNSDAMLLPRVNAGSPAISTASIAAELNRLAAAMPPLRKGAGVAAQAPSPTAPHAGTGRLSTPAPSALQAS